MAKKKPEYIGVKGIQDLTGAPANTVYSWRRRDVLPEPAATLDGEPAWLPEDIRAWWEEWQKKA